MLMGLEYFIAATLAEKSKVNLVWLDNLNLFIDTRLNISSENNDFGFHSIQKISHLNALGSKLDLDVKV